MKNLLSRYENVAIEWNCIKISFILGWGWILLNSLWLSSFISIERGACLYFNCKYLTFFESKLLISILALFLLIYYLTERRMIFTTCSLALLSYIVFSFEESYGVQARTGLLPLIFTAQSLAYLQFKKKRHFKELAENRINYSTQVIVACYTLSGISKLITSGSSWFINTEYIALQVLKSFQIKQLDNLYSVTSEQISYRVSLIMEYSTIISFFLIFALLTEVFSGLALLNKKFKFIIGILLAIMHFGVYMTFEIIIYPFVISMVFIMINPLYIAYNSITNLVSKRDYQNNSN